MATKIAAPKGENYDVQKTSVKRRKDIVTLRAKANLTPADRDTLLGLLMDDYLTRHPAP